MSLTLTRDELRDLSGRLRRSAVIRWLDSQRIPYLLDADGWPKVLRAAVLDQRIERPQSSEPRLRLA